MAENLLTDLRAGLRRLVLEPRFSVPVILTLTVGIAINVVVFALLDSVFVGGLPFKNGDSLYTIWESVPGFQGGGAVPPRARDVIGWQKAKTPFDEIAALTPSPTNLGTASEPELLGGARVTVNFFQILGARVARGRLFEPKDGNPGADSVVIVSDALQHRLFGDTSAVGNPIRLDGEMAQIVGVLPSDFVFPSAGQLHPLLNFRSGVEVWRPLALGPSEAAEVGGFRYCAIGKLDRVHRVDAAASAIEGLSRSVMLKDFGQSPFAEVRIRVEPLRDAYVGRLRQGTLVLACISILLLVLAGVNVTHLWLTRTYEHQGEFAIRVALGATFGRLVRQQATETAVTVAAAAAVGLILAHWILALLQSVAPPNTIPMAQLGASNLTVTLVALTVAGALILLVTLFQIRAIGRHRLSEHVRPGAQSPGRARLRFALLAAQAGGTSVVLFSVALLVRSYNAVTAVDIGFRPHGIVAVDLVLPVDATRPQMISTYDDVLNSVASITGVQGAALVSEAPLSGLSAANPVLLEGDYGMQRILSRPIAIYRSVSPNYFDLMQISVLAGRQFGPLEGENVAVVSAALVKLLWPSLSDRDAVDRWITTATQDRARIVGVVSDVVEGAITAEPRPQVYRPYAQHPTREANILVRSRDAAVISATSLKTAIRAVAPSLAVAGTEPLDEVVRASTSLQRFQLEAVLAFGFTTVALALVGVYGIVSTAVLQRMHEFGIRKACGASSLAIMKLIAAGAARPVAAGMAFGVLGAAAISRILASIVFGVTVTDPLTIATALGLTVLVAGIACVVPAARAGRVQPWAALRSD